MQLVTLREHSSSTWQTIFITQLQLWMDMVQSISWDLYSSHISTSRIIPCSTVNMEDVKDICHVKFVTQRDPKYILGSFVCTKLGSFTIDPRSSQLDIYWSVSFHLPKPRPMWSGCMHLIHSNHSHTRLMWSGCMHLIHSNHSHTRPMWSGCMHLIHSNHSHTRPMWSGCMHLIHSNHSHT